MPLLPCGIQRWTDKTDSVVIDPTGGCADKSQPVSDECGRGHDVEGPTALYCVRSRCLLYLTFINNRRERQTGKYERKCAFAGWEILCMLKTKKPTIMLYFLMDIITSKAQSCFLKGKSHCELWSLLMPSCFCTWTCPLGNHCWVYSHTLGSLFSLSPSPSHEQDLWV